MSIFIGIMWYFDLCLYINIEEVSTESNLYYCYNFLMSTLKIFSSVLRYIMPCFPIIVNQKCHKTLDLLFLPAPTFYPLTNFLSFSTPCSGNQYSILTCIISTWKGSNYEWDSGCLHFCAWLLWVNKISCNSINSEWMIEFSPC